MVEIKKKHCFCHLLAILDPPYFIATWVGRPDHGPSCSPAYAISYCNYRILATLPIAHNSWLKFKKNTVFAIYWLYWICHISLQHGWVDWYYGSPCSPAYVISYCSCRIFTTSTNSPQFKVKIKKKNHCFCHLSAILDPPYFITARLRKLAV